MFGSAGDDTLIAKPNEVEFTGESFRYQVTHVARVYVTDNLGGNDVAYLFDSAGDDLLSVRPQFSSLYGAGFFNYAAGFERVYGYSSNGGADTAKLYDSSQIDTFYTGGDVASIVGPGFFSYTRFFENVEAISSSGGADIASIYGSDRNTIVVASDFTGYQDAAWSRIARGFSTAKTFVDNELVDTKSFSKAAIDIGVSQQSSVDQAGVSDSSIQLDFSFNASPLVSVQAVESVPMLDSFKPTSISDLVRGANSILSSNELTEEQLAESIHREINSIQQDRGTVSDGWITEPLPAKAAQVIDSLPLLAPSEERKILDHIFASHGSE